MLGIYGDMDKDKKRRGYTRGLLGEKGIQRRKSRQRAPRGESRGLNVRFDKPITEKTLYFLFLL